MIGTIDVDHWSLHWPPNWPDASRHDVGMAADHDALVEPMRGQQLVNSEWAREMAQLVRNALPLPDAQATPNARVLADYASSLAGESGAIELLTEALRVMRHRMGKP